MAERGTANNNNALPPLVARQCTRKPAPDTSGTAALVHDPRFKPDGCAVKPLRIFIQHGRRKYDVTLKPDSDGVREEISMRHLAETVHELTKVKPEEQRFLYKGITWDSTEQNIVRFSPLLRQLGIKNGDKILLVSWPPPVPDHGSVEKLKSLEKEFKELGTVFQALMRQMEVIDYVFGPCVSKPRPLACLREDFIKLRERYSIMIQNANALVFDHRNFLGQTSRRELIDDCQRQMDKCTTAASRIFDRLALSVPASRTNYTRPRGPCAI